MGDLHSLECLCIKTVSGILSSTSSINSRIVCSPTSLKSNLNAVGTITNSWVRVRTGTSTFNNSATISAKLSSNFGITTTFNNSGTLEPNLVVDYALNRTFTSSGVVEAVADKFSGSFGEFECSQKLYPIGDILSGTFIASDDSTSNLYDFINEGVFTGD